MSNYKKKMCPFVSVYVKNLIMKSNEIGTCTGIFKISNLLSGINKNEKYDRFLLTFPYGGQYINWEVIFNANYPSMPPDFIFLDDRECFIPEPSETKNLINWDPSNPDQLFLSIKELIHSFKKYNRNKLNGSRLEFDYNSLLAPLSPKSENSLLKQKEKQASIKFDQLDRISNPNNEHNNSSLTNNEPSESINMDDEMEVGLSERKDINWLNECIDISKLKLQTNENSSRSIKSNRVKDPEQLVKISSSGRNKLLVKVNNLINEDINIKEEDMKYERLEKNNDLETNLSGLLKPEDIEVYVSNKNKFFIGPVTFMIKLQIDFKTFPPYLVVNMNPGIDKILLVVTYENLDGGTVKTQSCLSPSIEKAFKIIGGLKPIPFPSEGCLVDFIPIVTQQIQKLIESISNSFEKRKNFITCFLLLFCSHVLEYDSISFYRIHILLEKESCKFSLNIILDSKFPVESPKVSVLSAYKLKNEGLCSLEGKMITDYPYSPRWTGLEMAQRIKNHIVMNAETFKTDFEQQDNF